MELLFLALLMLLMSLALGSGYPVAFALPGSAIITILLAAGSGYLFAGDTEAYFAHGGPWEWLSAGVTNERGVYWEVERDTLIAIPLFIFMGIMLQRSKIAEDLLVTMATLFGPVPGGLGISVVFVGALLAATTGIVGATVVAMGLISLPAMLRQNYSQSLATGTIAASGTLGQIIPPSIVLIILADQLASAVDQAETARKILHKEATGELTMPSEFSVVSTSAGDMFLGAFIPGLVLVGLYMAYILIFALLNPKAAPAVQTEGSFDGAFWRKVGLTLIPPLALIFIVLGSIIAGVATVNQAGAIGAVGATIMAGYRLREGSPGAYTPAILSLISVVLIFFTVTNFNTNIKNIQTSEDQLGLSLALLGVAGLVVGVAWSFWRTLKIEDTLKGVMIETSKTTSLVFIILLGAAMLTSAFRAFGGEELVKEFLQSLPGGFWTQFVIVMAVIFVLGFFLDFIEIAVVVVPIVAPILLADPGANVTAVWLGVMIGLNIQTSFLTPPFGFALFYLRGVAPAIVKTVEIYKGVIVFIGLQLAGLAIVGYVPALVNYLPERVKLTSDTAPPPVNPGLQYCVEEYVADKLVDDQGAVEQAIAAARGLDLSALPKKLGREIAGSFDAAEAALAGMPAIKAAEAAEEAEKGAYRPLHRQVRKIEADVRRMDARIEELEVFASRAINSDAERAEALAEISALTRARDARLAEIPAEWEAANAAFAALVAEEQNARRAYRRAADEAYGPVAELLEDLAAVDGMGAATPILEQLRADLPALEPKAGMDLIKETSSILSKIDGTSEARSALSKARRALRGGSPKPDKALENIDKAIEELAASIAWRQAAAAELTDGLTAYLGAIRGTIGIRSQPKLSREQALFVAACRANHRDISLNF